MRIWISSAFVIVLGFLGGFLLGPKPAFGDPACYCDCQLCEDVWSCEEEHNPDNYYQCIDAYGVNPCIIDECQSGCECGEPPH